MRSVIVYTLARLLLVAATAAILYLIGLSGLLNLALAFLISGVVSYVVLSRQRDQVSVALTSKMRPRREGTAGDTPVAD
ncbi:DUF4229 domain-containing protein [Actinocorallia populi]|uniref:DUF4229 domain-containing protein n=1 Tax=Actinocorallia populi TaxID=2079200 RepID=UPI000D08E687|nr:DUF4229 domain-containing protein [Actinocorallia populi]